ncbi:hypothetical protein [Desulfovibrio sp.]|uniref:hypothetical protein n=1 Tax=Desulfovibrio sp. TaxID=885 RepID=UPI003D0B0C8D
MARKGGLGQGKTVEQPEDLLDSVFGGKAPAKEPVGKTDTPPPAPAGKADPKKDKVGKYFLLDRDLAKTLKLHAVMHETKEIAVIEAALREFFEKHAE